MARVKKLRVDVLPEESFAPFGELLAIRRRDPDLSIAGMEGWIAEFHTDASAQFIFFRTRYGDLRFTTMERHLNVTQTVILVAGAQLVALAPPTDPTSAEAIPTVDEVRAFLADETTAYVMKAGTWHAVGRFPLHPPSADFIMVSDQETSTELIEKPQAEWQRTQWVNYEERFDTVFEFDVAEL